MVCSSRGLAMSSLSATVTTTSRWRARSASTISMLRRPYTSVVECAAAHLYQVIDASEPGRLAITLPPELVVHASTAPPLQYVRQRAC